MNISEIEFDGIRKPNKDVTSLKSKPGRSWSALTVPSSAFYMFENLISSYQLSHYGAIRINNKSMFYADVDIPASIDAVDSSFILIPWGHPQILNTCGTYVDLFTANNILVFDFRTRDQFNKNLVYQYQVQFPFTKKNIVEFHYYHCISGFSTVVGAVAERDNNVSWDIKENQPYMKKALRINTTNTNEEPVIIDEEPVIIDEEPTETWNELLAFDKYKLMEKRRVT